MIIYRFMKTNNEYEIDWWMAFVFVLVPVLLISLLTMGLGILGLNMGFVLVGYLLYFIFPFLFLKLGLDFENGTAFKFAIVVPFVAIAAELPFIFLLGAADA